MAETKLIRYDLVDTAVEFLKNPKIASEPFDRKREFLQKKGLTDTEINSAFQRVPVEDIPQRKSSFLGKLLNDLAFAGLLVFVIHIFKQYFRSNQTIEKTSLNETIKTLEKSVQTLQSSIVKLEQTAEQLNSSLKTNNSSRTSVVMDELKQDIHNLKESFLTRSQVPSIPTTTTSKNTSTSDNDSDGIVIISEHDK